MKLEEKIQQLLEQIRPSLQSDGGDVEFVDVTDDLTVRVRLIGACETCPMSEQTLKEGIEKFIKSEIPSIVSVKAVNTSR